METTAQQLARINAENRAKYAARLAAEAEAKERAKERNRARARERAQHVLEESCGHVEATGNPRKGCTCAACSRRRKAKSTRQKLRRQGQDPDAFYAAPSESGLRDFREERFAKYGITREQYYEMLAAQDYSCAICGTKKPGGQNARDSWHIDHDHSCCPGATSCGDCVRGLLCRACNWGLGQFGDSIETLQAAIKYLQKD